MKRILWLTALAVAAVLGSGLFRASDVAKLQPVEVLRVQTQDSRIYVEADTGERGSGPTLAEAFADLMAGTAGDIFLDTVEYVLLPEASAHLAKELVVFLRPATLLCREEGQAALGTVADFLDIHRPQVTLMDCQGELPPLPMLRTQEGRMELVS